MSRIQTWDFCPVKYFNHMAEGGRGMEGGREGEKEGGREGEDREEERKRDGR